MIYEVTLGDRTAEVQVRTHPDGGWGVRIDGAEEVHVTGTQLGRAEWALVRAGQARRVAVAIDAGKVSAQVHGRGLTGEVVDPRDRALDGLAGSGQGEVVSPMPGAVVRVLVEEGAMVEAGDVLVVVEAMKMENEFKAPSAGVVARVHVEPGSAVDGGAVLVTLSDPESDA